MTDRRAEWNWQDFIAREYCALAVRRWWRVCQCEFVPRLHSDQERDFRKSAPIMPGCHFQNIKNDGLVGGVCRPQAVPKMPRGSFIGLRHLR
jgi:hypothetical protein